MLHKVGILGFNVKILEEGQTLRFNLATTVAFNADFDGDEINDGLKKVSAFRLKLVQEGKTVNSFLSL